MATDKPRFTITLEEETFEGVMSYKKKNKLSTQSKAIQQLVELGLEDVRQLCFPKFCGLLLKVC